jgi:hypothetical protein
LTPGQKNTEIEWSVYCPEENGRMICGNEMAARLAACQDPDRYKVQIRIVTTIWHDAGPQNTDNKRFNDAR